MSVFNGKTNSEAKDKAWKWKREWSGRGTDEKAIWRISMTDQHRSCKIGAFFYKLKIGREMKYKPRVTLSFGKQLRLTITYDSGWREKQCSL